MGVRVVGVASKLDTHLSRPLNTELILARVRSLSNARPSSVHNPAEKMLATVFCVQLRAANARRSLTTVRRVSPDRRRRRHRRTLLLKGAPPCG